MRATISGGAGGGGVRQSAFSGFEKAANTASKASSGTAQASSGGRAGLKPTAPAWKADAQTRASLDQLVSQLSALLESLTRLLNGVLEIQVAGGGAADRSRPSTDAGQPLRRLFPSAYEDGKSIPSGSDRAGAREISNAVSATTGDRDNRAGASDLFWLWGQFLDHDIDLSHTGDETLPIGIPKGDATFDPEGTGDAHLDFRRSSSTQNALGVRQQINEITALIDGSNIYGSSDAETAYLRSFEGGRLRMSDNASLPIDERGFYVAGDARANENIGLTAMHTLFAREHNRIADLLAAENPCWTDEQLFAEARRWVTAELQSITVNEFLPILLGEGAVGAYGGYQSGLDAQASNAFAAAAYRFGHSMVSDDLTLMNADGTVSEIPLRDAFFRPDTFHSVGPDAIFRGLASNTAQAVDPEIVDSLRNFVMEAPGSPRLDLAALNIQRGRDHGLPTLNDARAALGMRRIESFDDPAFREGAGARLAQVYDSVDDVDLWVGLLAEAPTGSGLVGPTQSAILGDQFSRLRRGDPDWYENTFTPSQVVAMNQTRLSDIIARNTGVTGLQADAMLASAPAYA